MEKKITLTESELSELYSPSFVWISDELDRRAGYKTKLIKTEVNPINNTVTFYVKEYKPF